MNLLDRTMSRGVIQVTYLDEYWRSLLREQLNIREGVEFLEFGDTFKSKWSDNLEWFYVFVEIIRCPNATCFLICGTIDDGSQLLSEYDDIQEVDG